MRLFVLIGSMLCSLCLSATTTLRMEIDGNGYSMEAVLTPSIYNPMLGHIQATTSSGSTCEGSYAIDFSTEILTISFDGLYGPGSGGGCDNESLEAELSRKKYQELEGTGEVHVIFRSRMFYMAPKLGRVTVVGKEL